MRRHTCLAGIALTLAALPQPARAKDAKLKPDELVARHLESIGPVEAIRSVMSRGLNFSVQATTQFGRAGAMSGKAMVLSKGTQTRLGIAIDFPDYPGEQFAYDGARVTEASILAGSRTPLGAFIFQNPILMREGLIAGVLTTAWSLLDLAGRKPLLSYGGLKKVAGKERHTLRYRPKKGAMASSATLFFEPETFRHVRTEVKLEGGGGSAATAPRLGETARSDMSRFLLVEEFDDFREKDGLNLPHSYTIKFTADGAGQTVMATWALTVVQLVHNAAIDDKLFSVR